MSVSYKNNNKILVYQQLIKGNFIDNGYKDCYKYFQPSSIDIPILSIIKPSINNTKSISLIKGVKYEAQCGIINIPEGYFGLLSPKSSIGRMDISVKSFTKSTDLYNIVLPGTKDILYLEIVSNSFNITNLPECLIQLSVIYINEFIRDQNIISIYNNTLLYDKQYILHIDISKYYRAKDTCSSIDMNSHSNNSDEFFTMFESSDNYEQLEKNKFYIFATKEKINIPNNYSGEMMPFTHMIGEFRVHYAGFFDPGFGSNGGNVAVLEIRPYENVIVKDGQSICVLNYYENAEIPEKIYGSLDNNYNEQKNIVLAKYFK